MSAILGEIWSQTETSEQAVTKRWKYEQDAKQNLLYKEMAARMEADEHLVRIQEDSKRKLAIKNIMDDLKVKTVSIRAPRWNWEECKSWSKIIKRNFSK